MKDNQRIVVKDFLFKMVCSKILHIKNLHQNARSSIEEKVVKNELRLWEETTHKTTTGV